MSFHFTWWTSFSVPCSAGLRAMNYLSFYSFENVFYFPFIVVDRAWGDSQWSPPSGVHDFMDRAPPLPLECGRDLWLASNLIEYGKGDGLPLPWLCYIVKDSALLADLEVLIHFLALSKQAARARNCRQHLVEDGLILQTLRNEFCHQPKWVWKRIHCC